MTAPAAPRVRALSFHAGYRCRGTGVCCSSGWDIPVEPEMHLRNALASGALRVPEAAVTSIPLPTGAPLDARCFRAAPGLPHGASAVLSFDSSGRCVFLESDRRCAVHRQLGHGALPPACREFPRIVTLTPLGVSITLSHYCPTAASLLFTPVTLSDPRLPGDGSEALSSILPAGERRGSAISILENPPGFPSTWPYEGLDAREALPPLLRPGVLMDWPSLERWEEFAVSLLADEARTPEAALDVLDAVAEEARRWTPADGPFGEHLDASFREASAEPSDPSFRGASSQAGDEESAGAGGSLARRRTPDALGMAGCWRLVADCVPHRAMLPSIPEGPDDVDRRLVAPTWPSLALPVGRWLAAKAFASWLALQGEGLRTTALGLRVALGVLRAEAARGCAESGRALDAELLKEAVRRADLLLVHLADPDALARRLSRGEASGHPPAAW